MRLRGRAANHSQTQGFPAKLGSENSMPCLHCGWGSRRGKKKKKSNFWIKLPFPQHPCPRGDPVPGILPQQPLLFCLPEETKQTNKKTKEMNQGDGVAKPVLKPAHGFEGLEVMLCDAFFFFFFLFLLFTTSGYFSVFFFFSVCVFFIFIF